MNAGGQVGLDRTSSTEIITLSQSAWYAAQTRSRHEHMVSLHLQARRIIQYLPVLTQTHVWTDRRKKIEVPLFPGYIFVRTAPSYERRLEVLKVGGVLRFVGPECGGTPIPDEQIESIRTLVSQNIPWSSCPFLKEGERVRIRGGALEGMEGIFLKRSGADTLVISVDAIQRSLSVSVNGYQVEKL